jgi:hypothetical protein
MWSSTYVEIIFKVIILLFIGLLRHGLAMVGQGGFELNRYPWLPLNSQSFNLSLESAGITDMYHHAKEDNFTLNKREERVIKCVNVFTFFSN